MMDLKNIVLGVLLVVAAGLAMKTCRLDSALKDQIIATNNAIAVKDSLRLVWKRKGESLEAIFALQQKEIDGLRSALKKAGTTQVLTGISVTPKRVDTTHTTRGYTDSIVGPPVDIKVNVAIRPDSATWQWNIRPRPIPLTVDVGCKDRYKPDVLIKAPTWAHLDTVKTVTTTRLCEAEGGKHGIWWYAIRVAGLLGAGYVVGVATTP